MITHKLSYILTKLHMTIVTTYVVNTQNKLVYLTLVALHMIISVIGNDSHILCFSL